MYCSTGTWPPLVKGHALVLATQVLDEPCAGLLGGGHGKGCTPERMKGHPPG